MPLRSAILIVVASQALVFAGSAIADRPLFDRVDDFFDSSSKGETAPQWTFGPAPAGPDLSRTGGVRLAMTERGSPRSRLNLRRASQTISCLALLPPVGKLPAPPTTHQTVPLSNGVAERGLFDVAGSKRFFTLEVPEGATSVTFSLQGGIGDADLYVSSFAVPTVSQFECRPFVNGSSETCSFASPPPRTFGVMVHAFADYCGVSLKATWRGFETETIDLLVEGEPVVGLAGALHSQQMWKAVAPGGSTLTITMRGGTGDADLYVRQGARPTLNSFDCRPFLTRNDERCVFTDAVAGDYFVMIVGCRAFADVSLEVVAP
jgi:hypothetical protein